MTYSTFKSRVIGCVFVALGLSSMSAEAGMTVYGIRDIFRVRLEEISFFILLLFVCAFLFQFLWNSAVKGFGSVPKLRFRQALSLSLLLGLTTLLILTMISGVREVLTPEAWRRQGSSYRLNAPAQEPIRRRSIEHLRTALIDFARANNGEFPPHDFHPGIPEKLWESPDQIGSHYLYSGGFTTNDATALLAVEPPQFGEKRFVMFASGEIAELASSDITSRLISQTNHARRR